MRCKRESRKYQTESAILQRLEPNNGSKVGFDIIYEDDQGGGVGGGVSAAFGVLFLFRARDSYGIYSLESIEQGATIQ